MVFRQRSIYLQYPPVGQKRIYIPYDLLPRWMCPGMQLNSTNIIALQLLDILVDSGSHTSPYIRFHLSRVLIEIDEIPILARSELEKGKLNAPFNGKQRKMGD